MTVLGETGQPYNLNAFRKRDIKAKEKNSANAIEHLQKKGYSVLSLNARQAPTSVQSET